MGRHSMATATLLRLVRTSASDCASVMLRYNTRTQAVWPPRRPPPPLVRLQKPSPHEPANGEGRRRRVRVQGAIVRAFLSGPRMVTTERRKAKESVDFYKEGTK